MFTILGITLSAGIVRNDDGSYDFSGVLDTGTLTALAAELRAKAIETGKAGGVSTETLADIKAARAFAEAVDAETTARAEAERVASEELAAELAALEGDEDESLSDEDEADETEGDEDADESDDSDADEDADEDEVVASANARWTPSASHVAANRKQRRQAPPASRSGRYGDAGFRAVDGRDGLGESLEGSGALGTALLERWSEVEGSRGKVAVARTFGSFTEAQRLTGDPDQDNVKLGLLAAPGSPEAIESLTAALCAPTEPTYTLATSSSTARPVSASLATYVPKRGKVSVYPTPKLSDIEDDTGRGQWTATDDANPSASKNPPATITCADSVTYTMYGLYRSMKIKNMLAMTFPELVEAYLNRLGALTSRLGDTLLLDAGINSPNTRTVTATANEYGAAINVVGSFLQIAALYREEERYGDERFDAWLPRWVAPALQLDILRMRKTSGSFGDRLPSVAEVTRYLANAGVDVTWTLDTATTWDPAPVLADGEALPDFPTTVPFLLAPKGNLRKLDRGDLTIGVNPGGIYRDNESNQDNSFTVFQESFEGLMDLGATNWSGTIEDVCVNGAQVADVTAITCGS